MRLGPIVTSFKRLGLAVRDPRCHKPHLRVLYNIMEKLSRATGTAFPDRKTIAEEEDLADHTVENVLYDLRKWGHIDWERRTDPRHKGRLLHYTLPVIRWSEDQIAQAIYALRGESTRPNGYSKYPSQRARGVPAPTGTPCQSTRPNGEKSTRPGVCSNLLKEPEDKTASRKRPAPRTRLPLDWAPTPQDRAWAAANFVATDQQISIEAEKFGNYHRGKGSSMADWGAAWRTWWGNGFHKLPRRPQEANGLAGATVPLLPPYWWRDNPCAATAIGLDGWRLLVRSRPSGSWSQAMLGPPPGSKGRLVPSEIIQEFRLTELYTAEGGVR